MLFYKDICRARGKVNWVIRTSDYHQLILLSKGMCIKDANLRLGLLLLHDKEVEQLSKVMLRPIFSIVVEGVEISILPSM